MPRGWMYDRWLVVTTVLLLVGGLIMVGSASTYFVVERGRSAVDLWLRHALHLVLGATALGLMLAYPYQRLASRRLVTWLLLASLGGLLLVLAMPTVAGAQRWIPIGPFRLQPSEFVKLVVVLFMARMLSEKEDRVNDPWSVPLPCLLVVGTLALLVVVGRDLGAATLMVGLACVMLFLAGLRGRYVLALAGGAAVAFGIGVLAEPYRMQRITGFLDPWADAQDTGFQLVQSLLAFGNGGLTGTGLGQSQQKAFFLPAAHTDFIFSIVGEELGLAGCLFLLAAFVLLFWRGLRAALRAPDRFGFYLAIGLTCLLVLQGLANMCVCLGLVPTKGLALPFVSYGGSSLLASMAAMGILLNVSKYAN